LRLPSPRRKQLLWPRTTPLCRRRLQIQRPHAMLQGPRHRLRAMGPPVPALVQEDAHRGGLGRTHGHQEEEDPLLQEGSGAGSLSVQGEQV
ncbi:hypothetical protein E4U40_002474, partial [Claviceps sp. LM458 group G5]